MRFAKNRIAEIADPAERKLAATFLVVGLQTAGFKIQPPHIVVLVHGIRTRGVWQDRVASILKKHEGIKPIIVGFDYLDIFSFWFPFFFRDKAIEKVEREIRGAIKDNRGAPLSVIAHSFGTYVISQILLRRPDIQLHRLLLCGAIIKTSFGWDALRSFPAGGILNDVGTQDKLPALARSVSWGYGNSGTFGFRTHKVTDRFFNFGHSDFFTTAQIETYWVPFVVHGHIVESDWGHERPTPPLWLSIVHLIPMKSVVLPGLLATAGYVAYRMGKYILSLC